MARFFISYKRNVAPDEELAGIFATVLGGGGHEVFFAAKIPIGGEWSSIIERELLTADAFVVLLSQMSAGSEMVGEEVRIACALHKKNGKPRILPIRLAWLDDLPYSLGGRLNGIQSGVWQKNGDERELCRQLDEIVSSAGKFKPVTLSSNALPAPEPVVPIPPQPAFDLRKLESVGGTVKVRSPFYVERPSDALARGLVSAGGRTVLISGPRQMGKSSLLARVYAHALEAGANAHFFDFQAIEEGRIKDLDLTLRAWGESIASKLRTNPLATYWKPEYGPKDRLTDFIAGELLEKSQVPVVLCLDEIDRIFKQPFQNDFFSMIRAWHNRRAIEPAWDRLTIALTYSTEASQFIVDPNQSPFNVGDRVPLADFGRAEIADLNHRHGGPLKDEEQLDALMKLLGGHPFLIRKALYDLALSGRTVAEFLATATDDDGPYGDHLQRYLWILQKTPDLGIAMRAVLRGLGAADDRAFFALRALGLVRGSGWSTAVPRCGLYASYFGRHL